LYLFRLFWQACDDASASILVCLSVYLRVAALIPFQFVPNYEIQTSPDYSAPPLSNIAGAPLSGLSAFDKTDSG
jgi:hypothetical protein